MEEYTIIARYDEGDFFDDVVFKIFANSKKEAERLGEEMHPFADYIIVRS